MRKAEKIILIVLFVISLLPLIDLLNPGLPVTHDGQDHVARIANFYQSLTEGNIMPRWAGNLNWGYGHPVLMFLYPLPSYFASFFHAIGFSFVDATKLVFGFSYVASILAMYLWTRSRWGVVAGLVGAVLYGFAPYRFVDLYVRGAIGEHVAFIFPPLIFWGLDGLAKRQMYGVIVSLATAGLILSHNAVSLMFLPIILLYVAYFTFFEAKNRWIFVAQSVWFILLGFLISTFFWIPAFFEGKYTLRDIVTRGDFIDRFVPWSWFFISSWNYGGGNQFTKEIGVAQWIAVFGSLVLFLFSKKKPLRIFLGGSLVILLGSLFFMSSASTIVWQTVTLLQKFQFPWRLLSVTVFISSVLGAIVAARISKRFILFAGLLFLFVALGNTAHMWKAKAYMIKPESFYTGIYEGTTDTGESSPIWSVRFMEQEPAMPMYLIDGDVHIRMLSRTSTRHSYEIIASKPSRLVENTLYFPGWNVFIDGKPATVEFQDPNFRGLMTFLIDPGEHHVEVIFGDTKLRQFADIISLVGLALLLVSVYGKTFVR